VHLGPGSVLEELRHVRTGLAIDRTRSYAAYLIRGLNQIMYVRDKQPSKLYTPKVVVTGPHINM
jgi:hypothetical protein